MAITFDVGIIRRSNFGNCSQYYKTLDISKNFFCMGESFLLSKCQWSAI